jgi:hypothetical protein
VVARMVAMGARYDALECNSGSGCRPAKWRFYRGLARGRAALFGVIRRILADRVAALIAIRRL